MAWLFLTGPMLMPIPFFIQEGIFDCIVESFLAQACNILAQFDSVREYVLKISGIVDGICHRRCTGLMPWINQLTPSSMYPALLMKEFRYAWKI